MKRKIVLLAVFAMVLSLNAAPLASNNYFKLAADKIFNRTNQIQPPVEQGWLDKAFALTKSFYKNASEIYYQYALPGLKDYYRFGQDTAVDFFEVVQFRPEFTACVAGLCLAHWYFSSVESQEAYAILEKYKNLPVQTTHNDFNGTVEGRNSLRKTLIDGCNFSWRIHKVFGYGGATLFTPASLNSLIHGRDIQTINSFIEAVQALKAVLTTAPVNEAFQSAAAERVRKAASAVQMILARNAKFSLITS